MTLTTDDINARLSQLPEIDLLELLEITSQDLIDRFPDAVELKRDYLEEDLEG